MSIYTRGECMNATRDIDDKRDALEKAEWQIGYAVEEWLDKRKQQA